MWRSSWRPMASGSRGITGTTCHQDGSSTTGNSRCADSKVYGPNMGPTWGRQGPGGPHVGPMKLTIWDVACDRKLDVLMRCIEKLGILTIMTISSQLPFHEYIDGLVQERRNSIALAMVLRLSCTNPSTCTSLLHWEHFLLYLEWWYHSFNSLQQTGLSSSQISVCSCRECLCVLRSVPVTSSSNSWCWFAVTTPRRRPTHGRVLVRSSRTRSQTSSRICSTSM